MSEQPPARRVVKRKPAVDPVARAKAEALHKDGMPFQMAMAVAHGKLRLNDALERMARKQRAERLVEQHGLDNALATQVAMGHVQLEVVLRRRRRREHRDQNRDRTTLIEGKRLTLGLHGRRSLSGTVGEVTSYLFGFAPDGGEFEEIHKLQVRYAYSREDWKRAKKAIKTDKTLAGPSEPVPRPQDRYGCSDKRLFRYHDQETEIAVTLLEGDVIRGKVAWFSRYEIGLAVRGDVGVVAFRHALRNVTSS